MPGAQDRWGQLGGPSAHRHEAINADLSYPVEQPERGSIADLRRRMERLPPGHPSSPYNDDMTPKPPVARLKELELPLHSTEQSSNGADRRPAPDQAEDGRADARAASASSTTASAAGSTKLTAASSNGASSRNLAATTLGATEQVLTRDRLITADEPYEPYEPYEPAEEPEDVASEPDGDGPVGSAEGPVGTSEGPVGSAEGPVGSAEGLAGTSGWLSTPTWADADLGIADGPGDLADEDGAASWNTTGWDDAPSWDDAPDLDGASTNGAGHEWSEPEPGADTLTHRTIEADPGRAADEPFTGPDGSWEWNGRYLTPDESRIADEALGRCRIAEGRNVFGGYGHSGLTPAMRRIEAQLEHGQLLPDTEICALKSADSFKEKLADLILRHPDKSAEELALEVHDGIRYTLIFDAEHYVDGTLQTHSRLKGNGFDLEVRRNCWQNPDYKGINSRWRDPAHDLVFEVQFHTAASWEVSQRAHSLYEAITDPSTSPEERARLRSIYEEMSAAVPVPRGCTTIPDYRKEG
jgi:hypothetical protein